MPTDSADNILKLHIASHHICRERPSRDSHVSPVRNLLKSTVCNGTRDALVNDQ